MVLEVKKKNVFEFSPLHSNLILTNHGNSNLSLSKTSRHPSYPHCQ